MIAIDQINKKYTQKHVLKDITLQLTPGKIYGLMGPNGAGKTTLIRTITRLVLPDSGTVKFGGKKMGEADKKRIGYMPEERGLYTNMRVDNHLRYFIDLYDLDRVEALQRADNLLERLGIADARKKKVKELSKGMSQKLQFIITVLHQPELLILDEPFTGLDPASTATMESILLELKEKQGTTILISTHRMEQLEHLCEGVFLLNEGRIVARGSVLELKQQYSKNIVQIDFVGNQPCLCDFPAANINGTQIRVVGKNGTYSQKLLQHLLSQPLTVERFEHTYPSLREVFLTEVNYQSHE